MDDARTAARKRLVLIQGTPELLSMADGPEETRLLLEHDEIEKELRDAQGRRTRQMERREEAQRRLPRQTWLVDSDDSAEETDRRRLAELQAEIEQASQAEAEAQQAVEEAEHKLAKATNGL